MASYPSFQSQEEERERERSFPFQNRPTTVQPPTLAPSIPKRREGGKGRSKIAPVAKEVKKTSAPFSSFVTKFDNKKVLKNRLRRIYLQEIFWHCSFAQCCNILGGYGSKSHRHPIPFIFRPFHFRTYLARNSVRTIPDLNLLYFSLPEKPNPFLPNDPQART